jgi:hypothetical protein
LCSAVRELFESFAKLRLQVLRVNGRTTVRLFHQLSVIDPDVASVVGRLLAQQPARLQSLYIAESSFKVASLEPIVRALHRQSSLTLLNVAHNPFGDEGFGILGDMLEHNSCLRELDIRAVNVAQSKQSTQRARRVTMPPMPGFTKLVSSLHLNNVS